MRSRRATGALAGCVLFIAFLVVVDIGPASAATTRFAAPSSAGLGNCSDAANACTITTAIAASADGDTIRLAAGTYQNGSTISISLAGTLTLDAAGAAVVLDGQSSYRVLSIGATSTVNLLGVTVKNGVFTGTAGTDQAGAPGVNGGAGGAASGGAITNAGTLTIVDSTITTSSAVGGAGGAGGDDSGGAAGIGGAGGIAQGGGIYNTGTLNVAHSTITGNAATGGAGGNGGVSSTLSTAGTSGNGQGGGIYNTGTLIVESSTISGNPAASGAAGDEYVGGFLTPGSGDTGTATGSGVNSAAGSATLHTTLLAQGTQGNDCAGTITDAGYNIDDDGTCAFSEATSHSGTDAYGGSTYGTVLNAYLSSTLASNGGPTQTLALLATPSPATALANPALAVVPASVNLLVTEPGHAGTTVCGVPDQRGETPAPGSNCAIGAYYLATQTALFTSTAPTGATIGGTTYTPTATATSGLTVTITVDASSSAVCSISAGVVSFAAAGTCTLDANQAGNTNFAAASQVQQAFTVAAALTAQTVSFTSTAPTGATVGGATYTPTATATSGLTVTITVDASSSAVCSISAGVVSFAAAGTCTLDANQAGDGTYATASQVQQAFTVAVAPSTTTTTEATTTTTTTDPGPRRTTTTTRPTTTTTRAVTTTTAAPPTTNAPTTSPTTIRAGDDFETDSSVTATSQAPATSIVKPEPIRQEIEAGDTLEVTADTGDVTFDAEEAPEVTLSENGDDEETIQPVITVTVNPDTGELEITVEVPPDTPTSIVTLTITAIDSRGQRRTLVYLLSVKGVDRTTDTTISDELSRPRPAGTSGGKGLRWSELPVVPESEVPSIVRQIQAAIPDDTTEQALVTELQAERRAVLDIDYDVDGTVLAVSVRPIDAEDGTSRGLVTAMSLAAASIGLIVLRRRTLAAQMEDAR